MTATRLAWEKLRCALRKRRRCARAFCRGREDLRVDQAKGLVSRIRTRREGFSSEGGLVGGHERSREEDQEAEET
jgi:hypothetical protein